MQFWKQFGSNQVLFQDQLDPTDTFRGQFWVRKKVNFLTYHISVIFHKRCLPFLWPTFFRVCEIQFLAKIIKILWPIHRKNFYIWHFRLRFQTYSLHGFSSGRQTFSSVNMKNCLIWHFFHIFNNSYQMLPISPK